jgi:hypothetical protein
MSTIQVSMVKQGDSDKPFYVTPPDVKEHIIENYVNTGKMTELVTVSPDGASISKVINFKDEDAKAEWYSDPILLQNAENRKMHNALHDIEENQG